MIVDIDLSTVVVLIIDDSRYARSFIKSALNSFGARQVVEASDAPEGIQIMQERKIDLVLADYDMQPMDGIAFTRLVRSGEVPHCRDIPIVMVSGAADMDTVMLARNSGINEFLAKPVSAESLFRRVRNVLLNPRPFVEAGPFVGPCRRTMDRPPPDGHNRRRAPPLPKPKPLIDIPPGIAQPMVRKAMAQGAHAAKTGGERSSRRRFKAGETIFQEGDVGDEAYVIESGRVAIYKMIKASKVVLGEVQESGVFGEMALIDDEPRMASAEASEDTICLVLPKAALKSQLNRTPDLVILVLETLLHDIRKMGRELAEARARLKARKS